MFSERLEKAWEGAGVGCVELERQQGSNPGQVIGIWNSDQAVQAVDALGWRLSQEEVAGIDGVSFEGAKMITVT